MAPVRGTSSSTDHPCPQVLLGKLCPSVSSPGPHSFQESLRHNGLSKGSSSSRPYPLDQDEVPEEPGYLSWHLVFAGCRSLCSGVCGAFPLLPYPWCLQGCPSLFSCHPSAPEQRFVLCQGLPAVSWAWLPGTALRNYWGSRPELAGTGRSRLELAACTAGCPPASPTGHLQLPWCPWPARDTLSNLPATPQGSRHNTFPARRHGFTWASLVGTRLGRTQGTCGGHGQTLRCPAQRLRENKYTNSRYIYIKSSSQIELETGTTSVTESLTRSSCMSWTCSSLKFQAMLQLSTQLHGPPGHEWLSHWSY